jgi:translation initiation factor 5A
MTEYDEEFEQVDAGASDTYPLSAGSVKKNGYMVFNGRPGRIVDYSTAKTGKHGHSKASITGVDIFNGRKYEDSLPSSHNVDIPIIRRVEWLVISVDGEGFLTIMDSKTGTTRSDLKLPDETEDDAELCKKLLAAIEEGKEINVTVLAAMGIEKIIEFKENQ